jgi:hypothetical protein
VQDTVAENLADQQDGHVPHGCPAPSTSETNARAARARSARPASVTLSRTARPATTAPALPRPPRPGKPAGQQADARKCTLSFAANVKPAQRALAASCTWLVRGRGPRPWPSVQSRRSPGPLPGPDSRPLCVRGRSKATPGHDARRAASHSADRMPTESADIRKRPVSEIGTGP